jgi:hypothetical protein
MLSETKATSRVQAAGIIVVLVASLIWSARYSASIYQDANADLKHYHIYNAFHFLRDRWNIDFAAAGMHTFFNPLLDVPYYLAATEWFPNSPGALAAFQGLYFGLLIFAAFLVNYVVLRGAPQRFILAGIAAVLGASGAATLSEVGRVFNDIPIAALVLFSLAALLPVYWKDDNDFLRAGLAGLLMGFAGALKLTGVIYAPCAVISLLITMRPATRSLKIAAYFCCGWIIGFSLLYGWWGYAVWQRTGNPFFPLFNNIFKSDWYPPVAQQPYGLVPGSVFRAIFAPFFWAFSQSHFVTEGTLLRDARPAIAYASTVVLITATCLKRYRTRGPELSPPPIGWFIITFTGAAYVLWACFFFSLRLGLVLETLSGVIIMLTAVAIAKAIPAKNASRAAALMAFGVVAIALLNRWSIIPQFGRVHYATKAISVTVPPIPSGSLILTPGQTTYLLPFVATDFKAVGTTDDAFPGYQWRDRIASIVKTSDASIFLLDGPEGGNEKTMHQLGLTWDDTDCRPIVSNLWIRERICRLHRMTTPDVASDAVPEQK